MAASRDAARSLGFHDHAGWSDHGARAAFCAVTVSMITVCTMIMETGHPKTYSCRELMISSNATGITFVIVDVVTVQIDEKTRKELDEVAAELGESASEVIQKAIHLAWFAAMQDKMRRESAEIASDPTEIASDPTERDEAELMRQCARYLAS